jgi:uncharacterized protein YyaL (SSP411 family)
MAHESFENPVIAQFLNASFISIKVDREERPDIDAIYMSAVQGMTGQGGWPLNVFLTPDGVPFFGGTYWPPEDRGGMPGFLRVLRTLDTTWRTDPNKLTGNADQMRAYLQNSSASLEGDPVHDDVATTALSALREQFDATWGGFGTAPKFPQSPVLEFLLRHFDRTGDVRARTMALTTLDRIAEGGIHDHVAGGFARYAVDREWLVPHFEKMLYDNGQLMQLYVDAWKITKSNAYLGIIRGIASWAMANMLTPHGVFCAALDADSEGEEGKFYVWTMTELAELLDPAEVDLMRIHFGASDTGNFEHGTNILHVARSLTGMEESSGTPLSELREIRDRAITQLLEARSKRVPPGIDDKIITSWNALMIKAFAQTADVLDDPVLREIALKAARFLLDHVRDGTGHLRHTWKDGQTRGDGVLEDYAFFADAMITLYQVTADPDWLEEASSLVKIVLDEFGHDSGVGFYDTGTNHEQLITRPRELQDGATPSGNAIMADVLLTLGTYRQDAALVTQSRQIVEGLVQPMQRYPTAFGRILAVLERHLHPVRELVFAGDPESAHLQDLRREAALTYLPGVVIGYAGTSPTPDWPMMIDRPVTGDAAAYLCQNSTCLPPVSTAEDLRDLL